MRKLASTHEAQIFLSLIVFKKMQLLPNRSNASCSLQALYVKLSKNCPFWNFLLSPFFGRNTILKTLYGLLIGRSKK